MGRPGDDNAINGGGFRLSPQAIAQVVGWLVAGFMTYSAINARVAVLEDQYKRTQVDILEIKTGMRELLQRR